jgi:hypothetical protein
MNKPNVCYMLHVTRNNSFLLLLAVLIILNFCRVINLIVLLPIVSTSVRCEVHASLYLYAMTAMIII